MTESLVYVYAVGDATLAGSDELPALRGVDGRPVRTIVSGELAAAVSSVDAARFSEEALRQSFEDLQWLGETARAHHAVVDALAGSHPVAPLRLATMYLDDTNVRTLLGEQAAGLSAVLDHIRGRSEWGVKAFAVPAAAAEQAEEVPSGAGPGTSYLMRRRSQRDHAARGQARAQETAERVHRELTEVAVASRRYPAQDPRLTGEQDEMVLNAAYLVDESEVATLSRQIERWDDQPLRLELTGPWAPYSFSELEQP